MKADEQLEQVRDFISKSPLLKTILRQLDAGVIVMTFDPKGMQGSVEEKDGYVFKRPVKVVGIPLLYRAGYIDLFGVVTDAGRDFLKVRVPA